MSTIEINVPDIGDFKDVAVIELLVKPGDTVKPEQSLITVESDKASMEIPSSAGGVLKELKVKVGDTVNQGTLIAVLEAGSGEAAAAAPAPEKTPKSEQKAAEVSTGAGDVAPESGATEIKVPDIGDFDEVAVIELLVKPGDAVKAEQGLITVESDKASMEIPSPAAGTVQELKVKLGDKVRQGTLIALLAGSGGGAAKPAAQPAAAAPAEAKSASPAPAPAGDTPTAMPPHEPGTAAAGKLPHASPSIRKAARELGIPLDEIPGSGPKGRITIEDLQQFSRAVMAGATATRAQAAKAPVGAAATGGGGEALGLLPWPKVDFAKFGEIERKDRPRIKKISAANLHRNWVLIPHVTNHDDADITELEAFRVATNKENEKSGVKVTMLAFLIKACVAALKKFPEFNSSLDGEQLVMKHYWHIGFAADTPQGLMVPVIKNADQKGVLAISKEMGELAGKAREGKLAPGDMQGATFTISSLGGIGGRYFTPIINAPEVAILGVCKSQTEPVWDGKQFAPRLMLPLSLSWDHRVIDGAAAARFNAYLGQILADFRRVLL